MKVVRGPLNDSGLNRLHDFMVKNTKFGQIDENYRPLTDFSRAVSDLQKDDYSLSLDVDNTIILTGTFVIENQFQATNTGLDLDYVLSADDFIFSVSN